jgi:hypothetical protein
MTARSFNSNACQVCLDWRKAGSEAVTTVAGYRLCAHHVQLLRDIARTKKRLDRKLAKQPTPTVEAARASVLAYLARR